MSDEKGGRDAVKGPPDEQEISIEFVDHDHPAGEAETGSAADAGDPAAPGGQDEVEVVVEEEGQTDQDGALKKRVAVLEDQLLRHRADFENYRRRQSREHEEFGRKEAARVIEGLLPALDNLDRAIEAVRTEVSADHLQGLILVRQQLMDALAKIGLEEIAALGLPFDPAVHEAVTMTEHPEIPPMTVTDLLQRGFTLGGKLLRPARVGVNGSGAQRGEGDA